MNINDAFPSTTLKAADIGDTDMVLTMTGVVQEEVGSGNDKEVKPHVYFEETEKKLVLNKTNANTIAGMYGGETDEWAGKKIALFATEVDFQGKQTLAIRVRMRKPGAPPQQRPAQGRPMAGAGAKSQGKPVAPGQYGEDDLPI